MPHIYAHHLTVPKTMRAIAKVEAGPGLKMIEALVPQPGPNDVLIKIKKTSIGSTDVRIQRWDAWAAETIKPPMIVGHEYVGLVAEVGGNVSDFHPGELVTGDGTLVCGTCRYCLAGRHHLCPETNGLGVGRDGAFADYLCVPPSNLWHVDPRISTDVVACFAPLGQAVQTALQVDVLGADVLILGADPVACMATAVVRHAGARHVVVADPAPDRLAMARRLGATRAIDGQTEKLSDVQRELGMKEGFDVGLEMSGSPTALNDLVANMSHGGRIAIRGVPIDPSPVDWSTVVGRQLSLRGVNGRTLHATWHKTTSFIQSGLDIGLVITHRFPVGRFHEAFELMGTRQAGKIVLDWES